MMNSLEKCANIMGCLLLEKGWRTVGGYPTKIFEKNKCFFVVGEATSFEKATKLENDSQFIMIAEIMVHSDNKSWHVEKDGFLLERGKINRVITQAYDYGRNSSYAEKLSPLIERIDGYACADDYELLSYKHLETVTGDYEITKKIVISSKSVTETRYFMVNPSFKGDFAKSLRLNRVYHLASVINDNVTLVPFNEDLKSSDDANALTITAYILAEAISVQDVVSVEIVDSKDGSSFNYQKLISGKSSSLDNSYDCFDLSPAQKNVVAEVKMAGLNFTPLLFNELNIRQMELLATIIKSGCDCECLVGKNLPEENLTFLSNFSKNQLPLNGFSDPSDTLERLKKKYSGFSETIEKRLATYALTPEIKKVAQFIAFQFKDFSHVLGAKNKFEAMLLDEQLGRFSETASLMLDMGIIGAGAAKLSWHILNTAQQDVILECYRCKGAILNNIEWDYYLETQRDKILALFYNVDGFFLSLPNYFLRSDYNSLILTDFSNTVKWRCLQINNTLFYHQV